MLITGGHIMLDFYKDKKILITGHTGFKGSWLCKILVMAGAKVTGYSLEPPTDPNLFTLLDLEKEIDHHLGDIRDRDKLMQVMKATRPEFVIHMAAQPIVRASYEDPVYTYETNVMGTVNICEAVRQTGSVKSFLNVTTDKVYKNMERLEGYREDEQLDGFDPYSNSKSCSELVTHSYDNSFFKNANIAASTARAGNVIGGGDFARDRIIPDCVRATMDGRPITLRNPDSVRPFQHVLEPLSAYLLILQKQYEDIALSGSYNVGPKDSDCITTSQLAEQFCSEWNSLNKPGKMPLEAFWTVQKEENAPHEAGLLRLDSSRIKETLGWEPRWDSKLAVRKTTEWYRAYADREALGPVSEAQIREYFG